MAFTRPQVVEERGQLLPPGVGNNAFSFETKPERPSLEITPLQDGDFEQLELGKHIAFQDYDADEWIECRGLQCALLSQEYAIPIYLFDNHNQAFYGWCEALKRSWFGKGASLVHMDAHYDDALPPSYEVDIADLQDVYRYTNEVLQIATFVKPAHQLGIFSNVLNAVESPEFAELLQEDFSGQELVLDLDLDVFCDEMSHVSWQEKMAVLKHCLPFTKVITMATSPFFIDQQKAIEAAKRVVSELFEPADQLG